MQAKLIKTDGNEIEVTPKDGKQFKLEELQGFVGGYIQMVQLPDGRELYMNEDGKYQKGLTYNSKATALAREAGIAWDDDVVGDCVLTGPNSSI